MRSKTRRFFPESYKKELIFKVRTRQLTMNQVRDLHSIPKPLFKRWMEAYPAVGSNLPGIFVDNASSLDQKLNELLDLMLVKRLEGLIHGHTPKTERQEGPVIASSGQN